MSDAVLDVLGIAGSLRAASLNRALLAAAAELAGPGLTIDIRDVRDIPLYDGDLDTDPARPASVQAWKERVARADALLIATPEYNHGVPGVLKNVIDWISRPAMKSPLRGKPVGIMGAAPGILGTARAQQQLKLTLLSTLAVLMPHPGVVVGRAGDRFTDGRLADPDAREFLRGYLVDFERWIRSLPPAAP